MWMQLLAVARNAFVEAVRQPFFIVWVTLIGGLLVLNPFLAGYTFEDDNMLATDMGLSMILVGGVVLAAFAASGVVSRELEEKTALTVVTKPLARPTFVVGKFAGVAGALVLAWWVWALVHVLSMRQGAFSTVNDPWDLPVLVFGGLAILAAFVLAAGVNYLFARPFGSTAAYLLALLLPAAAVATLPFDAFFAVAEGGNFATLDRGQWLAAFMILQASFLFAAVAVACSTRLGQAATLSVMLVVFLLGLTSDYTFGRGAAAADAPLWARVGYAAVPNLQFTWMSDALSQGSIDDVGLYFVGLVTLYTLTLTVGVLGLAVALFQTRSAA